MLVRSQGACEAGRLKDVSGPSAKINVLPPSKRSSELTAYVEICTNVHPKCL